MARAPVQHDVDVAPESDRLEGCPHPRATRVMFGHGGAEEMLAEQVRDGRLHHGWIFSGREGIGKATLAYRLARHLLAEPSERDPFGQSLAVDEGTRAHRQVLALSHPGLLVLRRPWDGKSKRFAASIPVEEVRRLRGFLALAADPGAWRVVIVDTADDLNVNAANALLKSLEEPPARTVFVLVVSQPGRLLATIRSRCRLLALEPLADGDLRRSVEEACRASGREPPPDADWPQILALAEGSARRALGLADSGAVRLYERVVALVAALPKIDWPKVHVLAEELATPAAEARLETFFELLLGLLARVIRAAMTGEGDAEALRLAAAIAPPHAVGALATLWSEIGVDKAAALDLNLDKRALVVSVAGRLQAATRS